jgi:hypothetical protein
MHQFTLAICNISSREIVQFRKPEKSLMHQLLSHTNQCLSLEHGEVPLLLSVRTTYAVLNIKTKITGSQTKPSSIQIELKSSL